MKNDVFILSSREDEKYYKFIRLHIGFLAKKYDFNLYSHGNYMFGKNAELELRKYLDAASVIIVLVSINLIIEVYQHEFVESILNDDNKIILPFLVAPCDFLEIEWLRNRRMLPSGAKAITAFSSEDRDTEFVKLGKEVLYSLRSNQGDVTLTDSKIIEDFDVFISHSHENGDFAELLKLRLEREKVKCWMDLEGIAGGAIWRDEIDLAIRKARVFVLIVSPESRASEYVTYEWTHAHSIGKQIIPIILTATQLHPRIEELQYFDFTNRSTRPWTQLIKLIKDK